MITQAINLNLIPGQVLPRVNVSQYDSGTRTLQMTLFNGEQIFNVPSGASGFIQGTKPDRTGFQYAATVTAGSNIVTIDITQQMTAVKGEVVCELVLANDDDRIATVNFIIYVEPAALADDTIISETELPLIEEAAELAQEIGPIVEQVEADANRAETAAGNAELWASRNPYIGQNGNWFVFDTTTQAYVDTQIPATGPQGPQGDDGPTGPQGPTGPTGATGNGITSITKTGTSGLVDTYTILFTDGTTTTFTVTNGQDGQGSGDMTKAVYDSTNAVADAGGIVAYVAAHSGAGTLAGLTDVALTTLTDSQSLIYDATSQKWVNGSVAYSSLSGKPTLGTAAAKNSTNSITQGSTDLIEAGAVYSANQTLTNQVYFDVPENYGAVGDGVTDDTAALQNCFTNSTKNIFLLRNKYKVSGKIDIPSDITIIGTNDTEIIDAWYGTSMGDNQYDAIFDGRNVKNVTIDNITFKGEAIGAVQSASMNWRCDICFRNSSSINIKNCKFIACDQYTQIALRTCEDCVISNNHFEWYRYQGIVIFSSHDCVVSENTFSDCGLDYINTYAIGFTYLDVSDICYNMKCLNNIIAYPNHTANWESIDAHGLRYSEIAGNIITGCNDGIAILTENARGFMCMYVDIHDNYVYGGTYTGKTNYGIISGGYNINIYNNTVNNCGLSTAAIALVSLIRECTIKNNHIVSARDRAILIRRDSAWNQYIQNLIIEGNDASIAPSSGTEGIFIHCYDTSDPSFYGPNYCKNNIIYTGNLSKIDITLPTVTADARAFLEFDNNNYGALAPTYNTFSNCSPDLIHTTDIANVGNRGSVGHVVKVADFANTSGAVYELRKTASNIISMTV